MHNLNDCNGSQIEKAWGLFKVLINRDYLTGIHSLNVACIAKVFSTYVEMKTRREKIFIAGLLHDVGKLKMPEFIFQDYVLQTDADRKMIQLHPEYSKVILEEMSFDQDIIRAAYEHHERFNGQGYPRRLPEDQISIAGKILAIADSFCAAKEDRPYRKGASMNTIIEEFRITEDLYDPQLLKTFLHYLKPILNHANIEVEYYKRELSHRNIITG